MDTPDMYDDAMEAEENLKLNEKEKHSTRSMLKVQERRAKRELSKKM